MNKLFDVFPYMENGDIVIKRIANKDADALQQMAGNENVYHCLPAFLLEQRCKDTHEFICRCWECYVDKKCILMGIYIDARFCGLAEIYHHDEACQKVTIGYRLVEEFWGKGIATEVVALLVQHLFTNTDIKIITASNIVENPASGKVLEKNGFVKIHASIEEDWGFAHKAIVDKWCLSKSRYGRD